MGVYIYEEQPLPSVTDSTGSGYSNYGGSDQGICITAKIDCTLDRVTTAGVAETLNIAQGTGWGVYDADTLVQYSLGGSSDYTLPTPYEMEANTNYVIWVTGGGPIGYSNISPLPLNGTNITTNYAISQYGNQSIARAITSVTTTPVGVRYEEKPLKNAYIGQYPNVQIFDFQNDGDLGWSGYSIGYGTPDYVTGEGWKIGSSSSASYQGGLVIPNSAFNNETLKSVKIYRNKPIITSKYGGDGCGICNQNQSNFIVFSFPNISGDNININAGLTTIPTSNITGEITTEYIMEDNGDLVVDISGTPYNVGQYASVYQGLWSNQSLYILQGRWTSTVSYIRKIEITTA